jgi:hypothetical protein
VTSTFPAMHPALEPLAVLLGTWEGEGSGHYPTIEPFTYGERITFAHTGKPFFTYQQTTWRTDDGAPLHAEVGYLRVVPGVAIGALAVEWVLAHPTGIAEVEEGRFVDGVIELTATTVGRTATAKPVHSLRRQVVLGEDRLRYDLWMAHAETPETHHLEAVLYRTATSTAAGTTAP